MPNSPHVRFATVDDPALQGASTETGRVSLRDPDGGRHQIEVLRHTSRPAGQSTYQVKVDSWYHVGWASSSDEVAVAVDRVRRAVISGWLPGDCDLPT
jgi:hypothetical protein